MTNGFDSSDKAAVYRAIAERRDMRHFTQQPVDESIMQRVFTAAHQAPNVGLIQPWRFIRIKDPLIRHAIANLVEQERQATAERMGQRKTAFLRLKVEGILQADQLIVACIKPHQTAEVFGRRTLPEMDLASVACAIQNMWLACRAEGIGLGWVSMFEPDALRKQLNIPIEAQPIAILSIGHVAKFYTQPMLIEQHWAQAKPLETMITLDQWDFTD